MKKEPVGKKRQIEADILGERALSTNGTAHETGDTQSYAKRLRKSSAGNGHAPIDTQGRDAAPAKLPNGGRHVAPAAHEEIAPPLDLNDMDFSTTVVREIALLWPKRQTWHRAEKSLSLQSYGMCRRLTHNANPDLDMKELKKQATILYKALVSKKEEHPLKDLATAACLPLLQSKEIIKIERTLLEKRLVELVGELPSHILDFINGVKGLGFLSVAALIGEASGTNFRWLLDFATVSRVWKRYCVAVMPDGTRQRRVAGEAAIEHGFVPQRRSVLWTIGDALIKAHGAYYALYLKFKEKEVAKNAEEKPIIMHARAKRLMEKRLLRDLWNVCHGKSLTPPVWVPNAVTIAAMADLNSEEPQYGLSLEH